MSKDERPSEDMLRSTGDLPPRDSLDALIARVMRPRPANAPAQSGAELPPVAGSSPFGGTRRRRSRGVSKGRPSWQTTRRNRRELELLNRKYEAIQTLIKLDPGCPITQSEVIQLNVALTRRATQLATRTATLRDRSAQSQGRQASLATDAAELLAKFEQLSFRDLPTSVQRSPVPTAAPRPLGPVARVPGAALPPRPLPHTRFGPATSDYYQDPTNSK